MADHDLAQKITDRLRSLAPVIESKVVDAFAEREATKRADALVKVIDRLETSEKELRKLGPDQIQYDDKGTKVSETYSKQRLGEREKANKLVQKLTRAINKAINDNDFGELYNLAAGKDPSPDKSADSE